MGNTVPRDDGGFGYASRMSVTTWNCCWNFEDKASLVELQEPEIAIL